jgi:diguanylate cyclase (GGDEF)-like protein
LLTFLLNRRPAVVARRFFGRFGVWLALSLILTLGLVEVLTYRSVSADLARNQVAEAASLHRADADSVTRAAARYGPRFWLREVTEQLEAIDRRDGSLEVILVDRRLRVVAAADPSEIGHFDPNRRLRDAMREGRPWAGHEAAKGADTRDFESVRPVTIHGQRYVLETTTDGEVFEGQLAAIRHRMLVASALAFVAAGFLFWLTGGRRVLRMHRFALERATRDGLTDLPNHRAFQDALRQVGEAAGRYGDGIGLLLLDLDGFKAENDRHGHRHGDDRLKAAAAALSSGRPTDLAFRVGGDEFALLLPHTDAEGGRRVANRLHKRLAAGEIRASIGVGVLRAGQSPYDLREEVDAALYEAKRAGGDRIVLFDDIASSVSVITGTRRDALSRLIDDGAVDVVFQPIWNLPGDCLLGVEALARPSADYGFAGPAEAFDTAYQLGSVHALDRLCVERILVRAPELRADALLFINLSPKTLELDADGSHWFTDAVARASIDPARVVIEVTERMGSRTLRVLESIKHLREHGFRIAIDDMGTGNSGLEVLRELQPEYVKLDRSIVVGALTDHHARGLLMGVTAFAHETGAFVIAEGIEDDEVLEFISTLSVRAGTPRIEGGQGYGLGRPDSRLPESLTVAKPVLPGEVTPALLA